MPCNVLDSLAFINIQFGASVSIQFTENLVLFGVVCANSALCFFAKR